MSATILHVPTKSGPNYIGIDVGTGSARACIIDDEGTILAICSNPIKMWKPAPGHYEQSTTDIWQAICASVQTCLSSTKDTIDPASIKGIGFDATCSLAVFSIDKGEPVVVTSNKWNNEDGEDRNVVLWLDHRPEAETIKINATKHNLLRYVGGKMSIEMEIPKVLWLKNNMPKEKFSNCKFYDLADALTHIATGRESRSLCSAVCKQGYVPVGVDGSVKGWQEDFLSTIGLQDLCEDNFKRMGGVDGVNGQFATAGEPVGTLSEKAAQELGLHTGVAVGSGVIDAYAGWIGTVGAKVSLKDESLDSSHSVDDVSQAFSRLAAVAGTSTCHLAMSKDPIFVDGVWGPYKDVLTPNYWMAEGGQSATGELLDHVIKTHPAYNDALTEASTSTKGGPNIFVFLNSRLNSLAESQKAPKASVSWLGRHLFYYGDLFGNRSPIADSKMRGSIVGLSSDKSIDSLALLYYGAMEFIALQTRQIIERMNESGHSIKSIFMSGSLCKNHILMELTSTICNMPVLIPKYVEAAVVHGAAMLGVKAASHTADGKGEPLWNIMTKLSKPGHTVYPNEDEGLKKLLNAKYQVFLEQCETQQRWRKNVDEAITS